VTLRRLHADGRKQGRGVVNILHAARLYPRQPVGLLDIRCGCLSEPCSSNCRKSGDAGQARSCCSLTRRTLFVLRVKQPKPLWWTGLKQVGPPDSLQGRRASNLLPRARWDVPESYFGPASGNRVAACRCALLPPRIRKLYAVAAQTFRKAIALECRARITELGVGERWLVTLDEKKACPRRTAWS